MQAERQSMTDRAARWIRVLCVPIVIFWVAVAALTNVLVPQLEKVGEEHNVALSSPDSPSLQAFKRIGEKFQEFDSDSAAMVVLEGDQPLGADAHKYYDTLVKEFENDTKHVQHVQDFWGDPLTAAGSQSSDGKAAYVQVFLFGNQGEALSLESVDALRDIVAKTPAPPGVKAYVAGAAAQIADQFAVGNDSTTKVTLLTVGVIALMLLIVYRSFVTMLLALVTVLVEMSAARGIVSFLANSGLIGLSTYSTNLLTLLVIAAGTDYIIFLLGRYHESRGNGDDRKAAYFDMYRGTAHVVLGSGLTIVGAVACLYFTRLPYFQSLGIPAAIGVLVALIASLTLAPAMIVIGGRFGLLEPKRATKKYGWRRIGTAIVRWPGPILITTIGIALIGLLALPGYKTSYDVSAYLPDDAPSNIGYAAAERHFSKARLNPELLMIDTDHDLRNPTDMILLERVAKAVFHTDGIAQVQSITRPLGTPLDHTSIPFQISAQSAAQINNLPFQQDRAADLLKQVGEINKSIDTLRAQYALQQQSSAVTHEQSEAFQRTVATAQDLRDKIANFDDFFRPMRNYFYWEPHCFDIPVCWAFRSLFDALDGIDALTDQLASVSGSITKLDALQPKLLALIPPQIAIQQTNRDLSMTNYATTSGIYDQSRGGTGELHRPGSGVRRVEDRRLLLPAAGGVHQPGVPTRAEAVPVAGRQGRAHDHHPRRGSRYARRHFAHRSDPALGAGGRQGNAVGGIQDLPRRYCGHLQGHSGDGALRRDHRRHRRTQPHPADHDVHHPEHRRRARHRRHGGAVVGRLVRPVGSGLAVHIRHPAVLGRAGAGDHPSVGRRVGLQPAAGLSIQGGDRGRNKHRDHPRHGGQWLGGDRRRTGVRLHHGVVHLQRPAGARPGWYDDRARPAVRHADRAVVHDAVHRGVDGALVLVAAAGASAAGA